MPATTLRYRRMISVGLASNAINLSSSGAMGHRVVVPMSVDDLNSFFYWNRLPGAPRAVGHFNAAGAAGGSTFAAALEESLGVSFTDADSNVSALSFSSSALPDDARVRASGDVTANDLVMAYILFKCFGTSSYVTTDVIYNLEDAQNMLTNSGVANAIQSSLEASDASGAGCFVDAMFTNLLASDPMRFFDASGRQVSGLFETNPDASGVGTWKLGINDKIEIPLEFTFTAPVTLNSVGNTAGELSGNTDPTTILSAGHTFTIRLQLQAVPSASGSTDYEAIAAAAAAAAVAAAATTAAATTIAAAQAAAGVAVSNAVAAASAAASANTENARASAATAAAAAAAANASLASIMKQITALTYTYGAPNTSLFASNNLESDNASTIQQLCLDASGNIYILDERLGFSIISSSGNILLPMDTSLVGQVSEASYNTTSKMAVQANGRTFFIYQGLLYMVSTLSDTNSMNHNLSTYVEAFPDLYAMPTVLQGINQNNNIQILTSQNRVYGIKKSNAITNVVTNSSTIYISIGSSIYTLTLFIGNGVLEATPTLHATTPHDTTNSYMAVDGNGQLYLTNPSLKSITVVSPSGVCTDISTGNKTPTCITVDSDNNVYYADTTQASITKFNPYGSESITCVNNNSDMHIQYSIYTGRDEYYDMPYTPLGALAATPTSIYTAYYTGNTSSIYGGVYGGQQVVVITKV